MAQRDGSALERELAGLKAKLARRSAPAAASHPASGPDDAVSGPGDPASEALGQLATLVDDLRHELELLAEDADATAHRHPFLIAGAAFLAGIALGRLSAGGR